MSNRKITRENYNNYFSSTYVNCPVPHIEMIMQRSHEIEIGVPSGSYVEMVSYTDCNQNYQMAHGIVTAIVTAITATTWKENPVELTGGDGSGLLGGGGAYDTFVDGYGRLRVAAPQESYFTGGCGRLSLTPNELQHAAEFLRGCGNGGVAPIETDMMNLNLDLKTIHGMNAKMSDPYKPARSRPYDVSGTCPTNSPTCVRNSGAASGAEFDACEPSCCGGGGGGVIGGGGCGGGSGGGGSGSAGGPGTGGGGSGGGQCGKDVFGCPFCRMDPRELRRALQHARRAPFELSTAIRRIPVRLLCEKAGVAEDVYDELIVNEAAAVYEGDSVSCGNHQHRARPSATSHQQHHLYPNPNSPCKRPPSSSSSSGGGGKDYRDEYMAWRAEEFALGPQVQQAREDLYRRSGARMSYARDFRGYWA